VTRRRKDKIKFSYENFLTTLTESEKIEYNGKYADFITIMQETETDTEIMAKAKVWDEENGTDVFSEAVKMKIYCIACQKVECDCCF
jgi:hypothetical protein